MAYTCFIHSNSIIRNTQLEMTVQAAENNYDRISYKGKYKTCGAVLNLLGDINFPIAKTQLEQLYNQKGWRCILSQQQGYTIL